MEPRALWGWTRLTDFRTSRQVSTSTSNVTQCCVCLLCCGKTVKMFLTLFWHRASGDWLMVLVISGHVTQFWRLFRSTGLREEGCCILVGVVLFGCKGLLAWCFILFFLLLGHPSMKHWIPWLNSDILQPLPPNTICTKCITAPFSWFEKTTFTCVKV